MMKNISKLSLLLPLALFIGAIVQDIGFLSKPGSNVLPHLNREIFILLTIILSLPLIYKQKWSSDRNVLRGLRSLFFLVLFIYLLLIYSGSRLSGLKSQFDTGQVISNNLTNYIFILSWAFFSIVFILIVLGTLRNLIYIKRRKSTARNFLWLMVILVGYSGASVSASPALTVNQTVADLITNVNYILFFIVIVFFVINSFRVSWINYLNKKQKIACFWGFFILLPFQILFTLKYRSLNPAALFSPVLGTFVDCGIIFLSIYMVIAFFALGAHLPTAQLFDRRMRQISSLHHLSYELSSQFDLDQLVVTIVNLGTEVTEADFCWLELQDAKMTELKLVSSKNLLQTEIMTRHTSLDDPIMTWLQTHREPYLENQVARSGQLANILNWKSDLHSLLIVPLLIASDKVIGILYAGKKVEFGFEQDDADMLLAFSQHAVIAVENARLVEESLGKERLEQELRIAHDAQMKLLPKDMPQIKNIELDAVCITANEVGGDYYDFFSLGQERWGVVIGDVSGKGPSAAFYMAEVKGIMEALAKEQQTPQKFLIATNEILYKDLDRKTFISLIYGIIDAPKRRFTFCRAGHCPVLHISADRDDCRMLEPRGIGLGLDSGSIFAATLKQETITLKKGCGLLLFTDGATEARNKDREQFGEERLVNSFISAKNLSSAEIKKKIIHDIYSFVDGECASDDLTFIVIKAL
jgi:phosphoserine phosphatase RsbU/P